MDHVQGDASIAAHGNGDANVYQSGENWELEAAPQRL